MLVLDEPLQFSLQCVALFRHKRTEKQIVTATACKRRVHANQVKTAFRQLKLNLLGAGFRHPFAFRAGGLKRSQSDRHLSRPSQQVKASQSLLIAANAQIQSVKVHALDGNFWDGQSQGCRRQVDSRLQNIHAPKPILKQTLE